MEPVDACASVVVRMLGIITTGNSASTTTGTSTSTSIRTSASTSTSTRVSTSISTSTIVLVLVLVLVGGRDQGNPRRASGTSGKQYGTVDRCDF